MGILNMKVIEYMWLESRREAEGEQQGGSWGRGKEEIGGRRSMWKCMWKHYKLIGKFII